MRFILNFIFFGILFYIIYLFFPDAFHTLVSWANNAYEYISDFFSGVSKKIQKGDHLTTLTPQQALLWALFWVKMKNR